MSMSTTAVVSTGGHVARDVSPTTDPGSTTDTGLATGVQLGTGTDTGLVFRAGGRPALAVSRSRRAGGPQLRVVRDAGMATAEYAVALIAACAFAAVLLTAVRSGAVLSAIGKLIQKALEIIS